MNKNNDIHEDFSSVQIEEIMDNEDRPLRHNINPMNRPSRIIDPVYQTAESIEEEKAWIELDEKIKLKKNPADNNGGKTNYYNLPEKASDLQDLIEYKKMNFAIGNIFKATYRLEEKHHSNKIRELNKIIWFAQRELQYCMKENTEE